MKRAAVFIAFILIGLAGVGCAATGPVTLRVPPGRYAEAFSITKDEIRRLGYRLARIDARSGVITSQTHSTAGLATPWLPNEASLGDSVDSFFHRDQRRIVVTFDLVEDTIAEAQSDAPIVDTTGTGASEVGLIAFGPIEPDRRSWEGELICRVSVAHQRLHRSGLRLSTAGVRLSSVTATSDDPAGGLSAPIVREMESDTHLASKLAQMIRDRLRAVMDTSEELKEVNAPEEGAP